MKRFFICLILIFSVFFSSFGFTVYADREELFLGGYAAGFTLTTKGAHVVGLSDVITENGIISPAKAAGVQAGDVIIKIDDLDVNDADEIEKAVKDARSKTICVKRNDEYLFFTVTPVKDICGNVKIGVFVKDDMNGIGTITFIKGNKFGSLGHPVLNDSDKIMEISGGKIFPCEINGLIKGERGTPGELRGTFDIKKTEGTIQKNTTSGVFGTLNENFDKKSLTKISEGIAKVGAAKIYSTITGQTPQEYDICIVKTDDHSDTKNFVIKITDKDLLNLTGGIVQGMSGSPIVQDGKLVGAVTHVFVNDPARGFGISIKNMLNN